MYKVNVYLLDGCQFATGFTRIVHGKRGDYVEFEKDNIISPLICKFKNTTPNLYYHWMQPINNDTKVYLQLRTVKYADYKIGCYYIDPVYIKNKDELYSLEESDRWSKKSITKYQQYQLPL